MTLLELRNISYAYPIGDEKVPALKDISLQFEKGEFTAIIGKSGSGKSTLFHVLGCLLRPDQGQIVLKGKNLLEGTDEEIARIRNEEIGFVFQQFHLLARANVLKNIRLPAQYSSTQQGNADERAKDLAAQVGLTEKLDKLPNQLSGGEQQRVAIARALFANPDIILADEPTGNLDSVNAEKIFSLLRDLNRKGKTVVVITHDPEMASRFDRVIRIQDGLISEDHRKIETRAIPFPDLSEKPALTKTGLFEAVVPTALENLSRNKIRAALTMLGVTVGIAAVFAMLTFGQFAKEKVLQGYQDLGANTVLLQAWGNWKVKATDVIAAPFRGFIWERDVKNISRIFGEVEAVSPMMIGWDGATANFSGFSIESEIQVLGTNEKTLRIFNRALKMGRGFTSHHIDAASPVCLIGSQVSERLFRGISPLDNILFLSTKAGEAYSCRIIGVLEEQSSNKDWRKPNLEVHLPFTYYKGVSKDDWKRQINMILLKMDAGVDTERSGKAVKAYFQQKFGKSAEVNLGSDTALISQMKKSLMLFTLLLTTIAAITLGVGGVGINNMMLVAVTERLKEIGLRKAVGATNKMIRTQFLAEAIILSALAGLLGVILGFAAYELVIFGASKLVAKLPFEWVFRPFPFFLSIVSIVIVGVASGIVPALKAEKLQVIEALRSE